MPFSATAEGSVSGGTCSLTEDCHAGPNSAMPQPTMKQNASRMFGVTMPSQASTASAVAPASEIDSDNSATTRRSYISAIAPAGIEISMIGSINAVCTKATLSADDAICVIAQAAPTPWINSPRLDSRLASQIRRNTEWRSGAATLSAENPDRFAVSVILVPSTPILAVWLLLPFACDACEVHWMSSAQAAMTCSTTVERPKREARNED